MRYILSRLLWTVPMILTVLIVSFFLTRIVPGDPVMALVGEYPAPPEYIEEVRRSFGLDEPLRVQLWLYLTNLVQGRLGFSFANRQPVLELVLTGSGNTLLLMIPALIASSILGVVLALLAARREGGISDAVLTSVSVVGYSVPIFWLGQVLIIVFAVQLHWLPAQGMLTLRGLAPGLPTVWNFFLHWILPGFATTLFYTGVVARVARTSVRETLNQDFVMAVRAKGVTDRKVLSRHVLPNALIPVITVIGYNFGYAVTGSIMVEAVFAWPGLGGLFISSITMRDYPVLQAIFLLTALTVVVANSVTDIIYGLVDPRVRHGYISN